MELTAKVTMEETKYCDKAGEATYTATVNIGKDVKNVVKVSVPPIGHTYGEPQWKWAQDLTMANVDFSCANGCGHVETVPATISSQITNPGCETAGKNTLTASVSLQGKDYTDVKEAPIPAVGHSFVNPVWVWAADGSTASATLTCGVCAGTTTLEGEVVVEASKEPNCFVNGEIKYLARAEHNGYEYLDRKTVVVPAGHKYVDGVCSICGEDTNDYNIYRLYGDNRFQTSIGVADALKAELGVSKFENIIIASGSSYTDALAGSYLAAVKNAPILITNSKNQEIIQMYAFANLKTGGTMYILGGESAVQPSFESGMSGFTMMKRLAGDNRYDTNLEILKEAALTPGSEILVCTGRGFADSLSASAVGKPILLVRDSLNENQKAYLATLGTANKFIIIGGESAVGDGIAEELKAYGTVDRVKGNDRYETSVAVADYFFKDRKPESAVLAYGRKFPDGLCGGPLAYFSGAPLLLTQSGKEAAADAYTDKYDIQKGYVLGGTTVVSDDTAFTVFDLETEKEKALLVEKKTAVTEESLMGGLGGNLGDNLGDLDQDDLEDLLGNLGGLLPGIFG